MSINQPYYRIMRPMVKRNPFCKYVLDQRFADDRNMLCHSYKILENDLKKLFEYVDPSNNNLSTYSHRTYELLLRAATEFETNCKRILEKNGYNRSGSLNITDYYKINQATRLAEYEVYIEIWRPGRKLIKPFDEWNNSHSLTWYQDYNQVKHNRHVEFERASLENLLLAIAGVYCILFAQFGAYSFNAYQQINMIEDNDDGSIFANESIFSLKPASWSNQDKYDFDWDSLKTTANPFVRFNF